MGLNNFTWLIILILNNFIYKAYICRIKKVRGVIFYKSNISVNY